MFEREFYQHRSCPFCGATGDAIQSPDDTDITTCSKCKATAPDKVWEDRATDRLLDEAFVLLKTMKREGATHKDFEKRLDEWCDYARKEGM